MIKEGIRRFMRIIEGTDRIPPEFAGAFITIGNFDGIHLGHRYILQKLVGEAARAKRKSLLITFVPHPKMILHPERRPFYLLTTLEEKLTLLSAEGLDAVILIPFTLAYAETTAEAFIMDFLWQKLRVGKVFIGHDYTFGKDKQGNEAMLATFGKKLGFEVEVIKAVATDNQIVSSTGIRKAIQEGNVKTAASHLGRPYNVQGDIIKGMGRGAGLGFPTANIKPHKELLPATGVYAALANLEGARYQAVVNIGVNPTFGGVPLSLEVHLLDYSGGDIYGESMEIFFIDRLREECCFSGPGALIAQIKKDVKRARAMLKPYLS